MKLLSIYPGLMLPFYLIFFLPIAATFSLRPENGSKAICIANDDEVGPSEVPTPQVSRSVFLSSLAALAVSTTATPEKAQAITSTNQVAATPSNTLEETISGFVAGASLATTKTIVKYPLDTATVRLQMPNSDYSISQPGRLLSGSFRGITTPLVSNIPAGAVFFAVKDATKEFLKTSGTDLPRWGSTSLAVLAATFPYMLVRNPSEVIKTRQQAGIEGYGEGVSAVEAFQKVKQGSNNETSSLGNFYVGYWENTAYTYPADVIKFVSYEQLSGGRKNLPPLEGAVYGAMATAIAQFWTTPLDVIRNRVMAGKKDSEENESYLETLSRIGKEEGLQGLFAGVSPRVAKAMLSGAIQFATYEETKQQLANFFQRRQE